MELAGASSVPPGPRPDWRAWYDRHAASLLLYARQWLPVRADAEDAVQAGFVKFWRHRPHPLPTDVPLLFAAVRCAALDFIRSRSRRIRRTESYSDEQDAVWWDADHLVERERAEQVQSVLGQLDPGQREVIILRVWAELSFAEIAAALGENINTVSARYRYGLARMKKLIAEQCHERP